MDTATLSRQLEARAPQLATASVEWMYQDPFWEARYGAERSRRFGDEDARYHVRYLIQALTEGRPSIMEGYATWLRTVLVSRGMCSLHLDQNFAGLQAALAAEGLGPDSTAHTYVQAGRNALRYTTGAAGSVQQRSEELARRAAQALHPEVPEALHSRLEAELLLQLSYLEDAIAANNPSLFAQHLSWYQGFWPRRELGALPFPRLLAALEEALAPVLADPHEVRAVLTAARAPKEKSS